MSDVVQSAAAAAIPDVESRRNLWKIIGASSAGTLIEWYDFYIFAALAKIVAVQFFPQGEGIIGLLQTLAVIWVGFAVRPFGAIVFGYLGDIIGRKYTFLVTLLLMGGATFAIGLMPTYAQLERMGGLGILAPIALTLLRILQGLALGGEYGGAATYIAEHCPDGQRGFWTSWIQTTATLGLFASLGVILITRESMTTAEFNEWGWRIPFLLSIFLVVFSYYLRMKMKESPLFQRMKATGKGSKNPLVDSFGKKENLVMVALALFGATAGQGVVWYTGQFYALYFLQNTLAIDLAQSSIIIAVSLVLATPFFVMMGSLSDKIGRKPIMMTGCLLAVLTYLPIFRGIHDNGDVTQKRLVDGPAAMVQLGEPKVERIEAPDAKRDLAPGDVVTTTRYKRTYTDGTTSTLVRTSTAFLDRAKTPVESAKEVEVKLGRGPMMITIGLIAVLVTYVAMVYGPIAAFLVELFPTKIRYTSMSLPYHIGNGVFGGLVPFAGTWISTAWKEHYPGSKWAPFTGLFYPMAVAAVTFVIGTALIKEKRDVKMLDEH